MPTSTGKIRNICVAYKIREINGLSLLPLLKSIATEDFKIRFLHMFPGDVFWSVSKENQSAHFLFHDHVGEHYLVLRSYLPPIFIIASEHRRL